MTQLRLYSVMQALNEGELSSHRMDEIWSSFGAELTKVRINHLAIHERHEG